MRLSKIKLAGFKSFVDPTVIHFPSNLTGVVGPNGCGKSNVIDAVRWVMGESSAKHLRGDSLEDVIFNGSSSRKPIGMATVELLFDNSEGAIGGAYASYSEVSVKRTLSRDGMSIYYLNGSRCRRKDITGIFLGTGLGPRSYAIIEQGMVSRLLEAKPEEMRIYLEEAAGISKYKERRRETQNRIRHTRENLERLSDLRDEVEKQLKHLQRQSRLAERYKKHKERERLMNAELLALRLRALDSALANERQQLSQLQVMLDAAIAEQRKVEAEIEQSREGLAQRQDELSAVQESFYKQGAEIARLEQAIKHGRELREQQRQELNLLEQAGGDLRRHLDRDREQLEELERLLEDMVPALDQARLNETGSARALAAAEEALTDWQARWDEVVADAGAAQEVASVERARIAELHNQLAALDARRRKVAEDRTALSSQNPGAEVDAARSSETDAQAALDTCRAQLGGVAERIGNVREEDRQLTGELDGARSELQTLRGRLASLDALQQAALGEERGEVAGWLENRQLDRQPRLAQEIRVAAGWERAVETVLGDHLEAVCVDDIDAIADFLDTLGDGHLTLYETGEPAAGAATSVPELAPLGSKLEGEASLPSLLSGVYAADDMAIALRRRRDLGPAESVVTRDGIWMGRGWLRVSRDEDGHAGVIAREQELRGLRAHIEEVGVSARDLGARHEQARETLRELERQRDELQGVVNQAHSTLVDAKAQREAMEERQAQLGRQLGNLESESGDIAQQMEAVRTALSGSQGRFDDASSRLSDLEARREDLRRERELLVEASDEARASAHEDREASQALAIQVEARRSSQESLRRALERLAEQSEQQGARQAALREQLERGEEPIAEQASRLEVELQLRVNIEAQLGAARGAVENTAAAVRQLEHDRAAREARAEESREALSQVRVALQGIQTRRDTYAEQFAGSDFALDEVLAQLADDASIDAWETELERLTVRIQRLGPINLAAIDEFKTQAERKEYLDAQNDDLTEALETLETAMRKIDRETRTRFKETFDRVDAGLKRIFPRLFGGGHAYLQLSDDDLLNAGVTVMARPPGKRNSTIHLLSGGEKAMTAVALIFAIFELNPAPFCMLDEVDAPLDDANVDRFCDIVREMSESVQFVVITHNKNTIEMASHLTGVTMQEAGVSRLVAVDIDEAVQLAAM